MPSVLSREEKVMQVRYNRKTSPKVIGGQVLRKNNHVKTARLGYVVDRRRPGKGFMHVLRKKDIHDFVELIPDWNEISEGIESIVLDSGDECTDGVYHHFHTENTGIIYLSAWQKELWREFNDDYFQEHRWIFNALNVTIESKTHRIESSDKQEIIWHCYFTESQAKAYTLMHVFLHELGHHIDRLSSCNQNACNRGEVFAEHYAVRRFHELWPSYLRRFGELY